MTMTKITRRQLASMTGAGLVAFAGGRTSVAAQGAATPAAESTSPGGVAGGGTLLGLGGGEVSFVLAVIPIDDTAYAGTFRLVDETEPSIPILIESLRFDGIQVLSDSAPQGRKIIGWATMNGAGEYPFLLQVQDLGEAGSGEDEFNLVFGAEAEPFLGPNAKDCDCGGVSYSLRSRVVTGDIAFFGDA